MIEMDLTLMELEKIRAKEKGLRAKIHLESAINSLRQYNKVKAPNENDF
ncbi:MAG: hypothetical protein V1494_02000 [Candidatus Diapherotrites archaeon]